MVLLFEVLEPLLFIDSHTRPEPRKAGEDTFGHGPGSATGGRVTLGESLSFSDYGGFDKITCVNVLSTVCIAEQEWNTFLPLHLAFQAKLPSP